MRCFAVNSVVPFLLTYLSTCLAVFPARGTLSFAGSPSSSTFTSRETVLSRRDGLSSTTIAPTPIQTGVSSGDSSSTTTTPSGGLVPATKPIPLAATIGLIMPNPYQSLFAGLNYTFGFVDAVARPAPTIGGWLRQVQPLLIFPDYTVNVFSSSGASDPQEAGAVPEGSGGLCGATVEDSPVSYPFVFQTSGWYMFVVNQTFIQPTVMSFFAWQTLSIAPLPTVSPHPASPTAAYTVFAAVVTSMPTTLPINTQPTNAKEKLGVGLGVTGGIFGLLMIVVVVYWVKRKHRMEQETLAFTRLSREDRAAFLAENPRSWLNPARSDRRTYASPMNPPAPPGTLAYANWYWRQLANAQQRRAIPQHQAYGITSGMPHSRGWQWNPRDHPFLAGLSMARPIVLDLLRPLASCRGPRQYHSSFRIPKPLAQYSTLLASTKRASIPGRRSIFSLPSTSSTPSPAQQPIDPVLTPFQIRIAALETEAHAHPESFDVQLKLLRELLAGGEVLGLAKYYEAVALNEVEKDRSKVLLGSEEAWSMFVESLGRGGRLGEVAGLVRRRDRLLAGAATIPALSTSPQSSSSVTETSSPTPPASSFAGLLSSVGSGTPLAPASGSTPGSPLSPIYVQMAPPTPQMSLWRAARWLLGVLIWAFIALTILSMVMENTGLLKAGPGPMEFEPEEGKVVKFSDVHGVEEAKNAKEIVEFLKNPEKFSTLGGRLPKGVLLTGPPGTGKTMLARAVAGEADVPFLFASGSSFDEMFVGVGAKRVRELFAAARKKAPAIVFIDELDAIGSKRSAKDQHYMKQTLNQLLVELDGFQQSESVIIIAATNFPESLDKALTRPGRFDRHVVVGLPDVRGRVEILKHHMGEVQFDVDVDPSIIARGCPGMSGADLQNLVNQAAVKASREGMSHVQLKHFEWAKGQQLAILSDSQADQSVDRILMGAERRSHFVTEQSKRATAYHEGGHALVAMHTPGAMPLHKVTIMPRGQALGITFQLPEADKDSYTRREYNAMIDVALGGRAAEEMIYGREDVTSGCSSDLQRATDVAARMIRSYGFSDKVGLVAHGDDESVYLSGKKKDEIESEIKVFLDTGLGRAEKLLKDHENDLHKLASALIEYETLSLDEVRLVLNGGRLQRPTSEGTSLMGIEEREGQGPVVEGI
ncbi:MAG: hypothetical protein TREMPRED_002141 [Tremellales sp. Tagirdzhanova-0007]|nr:MAG: hypothetical protein TREMPRED_002141 [Tremellales sp. Tagirdzhanova-0007]